MTGTPVVALVAAVAENGVIGRAGGLPWRIPSEMRHFRRLTLGKPVIMGRATFLSLKKPLQGRDNIVLTRGQDVRLDGAIAAASVEEALKLAADCAARRNTDEIMVIGGAEIYAAMLPYVRRLYLTRIHAAPEGDVHFPAIDLARWRELERQEHRREPGDEHDYATILYERDAADPVARY
jgi:dihydrofolate reductase